MATTEQISLTFDGKIAKRGKMLLYEYGRSQYAFSRIITTVEQYRRTGKIFQSISPKRRVDLVVSVPKEGSFQLDVEMPVVKGKDGYGDFDALFALVLDRLIPEGEEFSSLAASLAKIKIAEIAGGKSSDVYSATSQEKLAKLSSGEAYDPELARRLFQWALNSSNRAIARAEISQDDLERALRLTKSDIERRKLVAEFSGKVDGRDIDRLTARVRTIFTELAVPLGTSATSVSIGTSSDTKKFYFLDAERLKHIGSRSLDEQEVNIDAKIKNFDVESATGSFRIDGKGDVKRFAVDPTSIEDTKAKVVAAMHERIVSLTCAVYTDSNGIITSYLIRDVEEEED